jgi:hypothetical protein
MNRRGFFSALAGMALAPIMPQSEPTATGWDLARRDRLRVFRETARKPWSYYPRRLYSGEMKDGITRIYFLTRDLGESQEDFEKRRQRTVDDGYMVHKMTVAEPFSVEVEEADIMACKDRLLIKSDI